jgi:CubicO group peptidase (beta-lactamase class C family)
LWHNGGTGGSGSFIGADPITHTGVVVLSNTASETYEPQTQLGHALQALVAGTEPLAVTLPAAPRSLPVALLDRYAGDFALVDGSTSAQLSIARDGTSLYARLADGHPQQLQATSDTAFYTRWLPVTLTFHSGATRAADFWTIEQPGSVLTARRN